MSRPRVGASAAGASASARTARIVRITRNDLEVRYVSVFDFRNDDDRIDGRFVMARVVHCPECPDLAGTDVLIEATQIRLIGVMRGGAANVDALATRG